MERYGWLRYGHTGHPSEPLHVLYESTDTFVILQAVRPTRVLNSIIITTTTTSTYLHTAATLRPPSYHIHHSTRTRTAPVQYSTVHQVPSTAAPDIPTSHTVHHGHPLLLVLSYFLFPISYFLLYLSPLGFGAPLSKTVGRRRQQGSGHPQLDPQGLSQCTVSPIPMDYYYLRSTYSLPASSHGHRP